MPDSQSTDINAKPLRQAPALAEPHTLEEIFEDFFLHPADLLSFSNVETLPATEIDVRHLLVASKQT